jgi:hypothetical protein
MDKGKPRGMFFGVAIPWHPALWADCRHIVGVTSGCGLMKAILAGLPLGAVEEQTQDDRQSCREDQTIMR